MLRGVESRGVLETAHRLMNYCGNIYRYAVATGRAERHISSDLRGALPPPPPLMGAARSAKLCDSDRRLACSCYM